jgi:DNA-directed RNA polymerase subunit RPC12/RpoP
MPWGFADSGVRCRQCGHFLNVLSQAISELPDPLQVTCPYCGHNALYPKSAICSDIAIIADKARMARWAPLVLAVLAIVFLLGLIATRAHSAEADQASCHAGTEDCAMVRDEEKLRRALNHPQVPGAGWKIAPSTPKFIGNSTLVWSVCMRLGMRGRGAAWRTIS